jgi:hypothetical protein
MSSSSLSGPAAYHTIPSLISPSFNVLAKSSIEQREEAFEHQNKLSIPNQSRQSSQRPSIKPSPPSRASSHSKQPSTNRSQHHRLIFHAQSLLGTDNPDQTLRSEFSQIPGGAYRPSPHPPRESTSPREMELRKVEQTITPSGNSFKPITAVQTDYQPTHLTKDDVKHARNLFRGILETTEGMLTKQQNRVSGKATGRV